MKAPIKSKKHIFQISLANVTQGALVNTVFADAQEATSTTPQGVEEGAIVKACFVEYWVANESASVVGSYTVTLQKLPGASSGMTAGNAAALHDYDNKKNIFFISQALVPVEDAGVIPVMRGWYKIPKGKQRFGLNDRLVISIRNNNGSAVDLRFCGLVIFKEYT